VSPKLLAAHQLSVVVFNFADAMVEVTQRGLSPFSVLLLAAGLQRAPHGLEIPASLHVSARWWAALVVMPVAVVVVAPVTGLVVVPVTLPVVASVALLVPMSVSAISPLAAPQVSVVIFNFSSALVEVPE
jgi:hypothetical protein